MTTANYPFLWVGRKGATHIAQSGLDDPSVVLKRSLGANFKKLLKTAFDNCNTAKQLEVLLCLTTGGYSCFLHARKATASTDAPVEAATGSTAAIADAAEQYLPELYGIETGDLWLEPLISGNVLTCRAVETTREWSFKNLQAPIRAMNRWARTHNHAQLVYQLLVEPKRDDSYDVSLRILQLTAQPPASPREIGSVLNAGIVSPLDAIGTENIISARQLAPREWEPAAVDWCGYDSDVYYPSAGQLVRTDSFWNPRMVRSRQALTSHIETQGLMTATTLHSHYDPFDVSPKLSADSNDLEALFDFFPLLQTGISQHHEWLSSPRFDRTKIVREPTGTDTAALLPPPPTGWREPIYDQRALTVISNWFATNQSQETDHWAVRINQPHLSGESPIVDGYVAVVDQTAELSDIPIGTAAGLVSVANQAVGASEPLWIAAVDKESGKWATRVLREPIKATHTTTVEPYTLPKAWSLEDGTVPLVDRRHDPNWRITPSGRWHVEVNGIIRAEGSLADLATAEILTLPRLRETNSGYSYFCPDDDPHHYETVEEIKSNLQSIPQPYPPRWPTFADRTNVLYADSTTLRPVRLRPAWHHCFESGDRYFETALGRFISTLTVPRPETAPAADNVWHWLVDYYLGQTDYNHTKPWLNNFADLFETRIKHGDDGTLIFPERSWPVHPLTVPADAHLQSH